MDQQISKKSVLPSVGADASGIEALLTLNLPEVFGEGDPARRRAAIQELYTEDCVLYDAEYAVHCQRSDTERETSAGVGRSIT